MEEITIKVSGETQIVKKSDYALAKTNQLRAWDSNITVDEVLDQLDIVLSGGIPNAIGIMIEGDLVREGE